MIIQKSLKNNSSFLILIDILLILCSFLFIPKLSATILPQRQVNSLDKFLQQIETKQAINPQQFWQFREFYSPGYFETKNNGGMPAITMQDKSVTNKKYFTSSKIQSVDAVTQASSLSAMLQIKGIKKVILQTNTLLLVQRQEDIVLAFILPESEMEKANGLFNYQENAALLKGKNWFNVTVIK